MPAAKPSIDDDPIQPGEALVENYRAVTLELDLRCEHGTHHRFSSSLGKEIRLGCGCSYFLPGYLGAPRLIRSLSVAK